MAGAHAAHPGFLAGLERAELCGNGAGRFLPELMTADAVDIAMRWRQRSRVTSFGISLEPPKSVAGGIFIIAYQ